MQAMSR